MQYISFVWLLLVARVSLVAGFQFPGEETATTDQPRYCPSTQELYETFEQKYQRLISVQLPYDYLETQEQTIASRIKSALGITTETPGVTETPASSDLPQYCRYEHNNAKEVVCEGRHITEVSEDFRTRVLTKLTFKNTSIQVLDSDNTRNLPRMDKLLFVDGILMKFDGTNFLRYQQYLAELHIIRNHIYDIPFLSASPDTLDNSLKILNLQDNVISFLPSPVITNASVLKDMEYLSLEGNHLGVLPKEVFYPFRNSNLKVLSLKRCSIFDFEQGTSDDPDERSPFRYVNRLEKLDLSGNPFLDEARFEDLFSPFLKGNMTSLLLSNNNYQSVPRSALNQVSSSLKRLELKHSSLLCIDTVSFPYMPQLRILNLEYSRIVRIVSDAFNSLPKLEYLFLAGNLLTTLPADMFIPKIKVLMMGNNPSEMSTRSFTIKNFSFNSMSSLQALSMKKNKIPQLESSDLIGLVDLYYLELNNCGIEDLLGSPFISLVQLRFLWMAQNEIKYLDSSTFLGLDQLISIDLSGNRIQLYSTVQFNHNIPKILQRTILSENQHPLSSEVSSYTELKGLHNVCYLNLAENDLRFLNESIFESFVSLSHLDLSQNRIQQWTQEIFGFNTHLLYVNIQENEMETFTEAMSADLCSPNRSVYASGNTLSCSCDLFNLVQCQTAIEDFAQLLCYRSDFDWIPVTTYLNESSYEDCLAETQELSTYVDTKILVVVLLLGSCILSIIAAITFRNRWYLKYIIYKYRSNHMSKEDEKPYIYDIFVSYSHHDRQWVFEKLVNKLEMSSSKFRVCVHERDFIAGEEITKNIVNSIQNSRKVVVVISKEFLKSDWCMFEFNITSAQVINENASKLIVILLEEIPTPSLPAKMQQLLLTMTYIQWKKDKSSQKQFWGRLHRAISTSSKSSDLSTEDEGHQSRKAFGNKVDGYHEKLKEILLL